MSCATDNIVQAAYRFDVTGGPKGLVIGTEPDEVGWIDAISLQRTCGDAASELGCEVSAAYVPPGIPSASMQLEDVPDGEYTLLVSFANDARSDLSLPISIREFPPTHGACTPDVWACLGGNICHALTPGAQPTCDPPGCKDGSDNDGDGRSDFPADPGCESPDDRDEDDPAIAPVCADGVDNDGDGQHDWPDDPGCKAASDSLELDDCASGVVVRHYREDTSITAGSVPLAYSAASLMTAPASCDPAGLSAQGGEAAYGFTIDRPVTKVRFDATGKTTSSDVQTALYVRTPDCAAATGTEPCAASTTAVWFHLDLPSPAQGSYVVIADKLGPATSSNMTFFNANLYVTAYLPHGAACEPLSGFYQCSSPDVCGSTSHVCE